MAKSPCFNSNVFLLLTAMVFFMLLYVYLGGLQSLSKKVEMYTEYKLMNPDKTVVLQGLGVPDVPLEASQSDQTDTSSPAVDGTENGPRSKFLFAFNECKPECCESSGGYICKGGCPCMSPEQKKFAFSRGFNHQPQKCKLDSFTE